LGAQGIVAGLDLGDAGGVRQGAEDVPVVVVSRNRVQVGGSTSSADSAA
jgi:hypothetical protein